MPRIKKCITDAERKQAMQTLLDAEKNRKQPTQMSVTHPKIEIEDSYTISTLVAKHRIANGARLVGLTSKAMQASSQINRLDHGHLLDDMMIADRAKMNHADRCVPRVEVELAFVLGKPLKGPGISLFSWMCCATEYVVPALEIVDARIVNPRKIFDTVAAMGIVIGGRPVGPMDGDLRWVGSIMFRNSEIGEIGLAAGVLGDFGTLSSVSVQFV
jgi:2-oxo-hept-3-ene-1,7-dioate hydratase